MKPINQVLGHWTCEGGGRAEVYQTKKAGKHFYTRCDCCGLMQGTGKARQQRIFDEAEFLDQSLVEVPSGVVVGDVVAVAGHPSAQAPEPGESERAGVANSSGMADFDPNEISSEPAPAQGKGLLAKLAPFVALAVAVGAGAWMS